MRGMKNAWQKYNSHFICHLVLLCLMCPRHQRVVGVALNKQFELENLFWHILRTNNFCLRQQARKYAAADNYRDRHHEILLQLWRNLEKYEDRTQLDTWAYKIAINTAGSFRRSLRWRLNDCRAIVPINYGSAREECLSRTDIPRRPSEILMEFVLSLKGIDQLLFLMHFLDMTYRQISDLTGLSRMHVAMKVGRIKRLVIKYLRQ
jgi:RNA polymerase sigma-70 factor (ECF subfamily)